VPVLALVVVDGVAALTARSLARAATTAVISPAGLLREGNALTNAAFSVCYMAGPALGGTIVVTNGTTAALFTNAGLFALIALTVGTTRGLPGAVQRRVPSAGRLRSALAYARAQPSIRVLLTLQAVAWAFLTISIPVEVVFAQQSLHAGAGGYAGLLSAWGAGAVAGSVVYARWNRLPARTLIAAGAASLGAGFVAMAIAPSLAVAIAGAAVAGIGNGIEPVAARTVLQEHVEQHWMALMMALNDSIYEAVPGVGILLGGAIALVSGPREALAVAGVGGFAVTAAVWVVLRPGAGRLQAATAEPAPATSSSTPSRQAPRAASRPGSAGPSEPAPEGSQAGAS
jgi:hypothetical protein